MPKNKVNNNIKLKSGGGLINDATDGLRVDAGTTEGKVIVVAAGDKLPAVDGSLLTGTLDSTIVRDFQWSKIYYNSLVNPNGSHNGGLIDLYNTSNHSYMSASFPLIGETTAVKFNSGKKIIIKTYAILNENFNSFGLYELNDFGNGGGTGNQAQIRFINNGVLKTYVGKGDDSANLTSATINGITTANYNLYEIQWNGIDEVKFYINGTLVNTTTTNCPKANTNIIYFGIGAGQSKHCYCHSDIWVKIY